MGNAEHDYRASCEREHALRQHAARAMQPSTCKRSTRQPSILVRIARALGLLAK